LKELPFLTGAHGKGPFLVLLFFVSATVITVWGTWEGTLPASEEAVLAEMAREILTTGDGWTMHFDSMPVDDVSPLPLWFMAAFYRVIGQNEFSARLPFVLFAVLTFFVTYLMGMECGDSDRKSGDWINYSRAIGLLSAIILASSPLFGRYAPHIFPAVPHAFFTALALLGLLSLPERRSGSLLWAIGLSGAILVSGASAIAILAGALAVCLTDRGRRCVVRNGWFLLATVAALAAGGAWLISSAPPGAEGFYDNQLWSGLAGFVRPEQGAVTGLFGQAKDAWLLNLPWSIVVLVAVLQVLFSHGKRAADHGIEAIDRALAVFLVVAFAILAFTKPGKMEQMITLLPAAAVIAAREITRRIRASSLEKTVSRLWSFNQALVSLFCLLMLLLLATPLRLHKVDADPIKEIAVTARQYAAEGESIGNFNQPYRTQGARMLFYGGRSLDRPFSEADLVAGTFERDPGKIFLSTFEDFRALQETDVIDDMLHMIYRAGPLVLFSAGSGPEEVPR
jgi:4-amino-4-deoxy-L-arabinose transferase-like glycosyltransferase